MLSNNSICNNCSIKKFCKHYEYATSNMDVTISINTCSYTSNNNINVTTKDITEKAAKLPYITPEPKPVPWQPYTYPHTSSNINKVTCYNTNTSNSLDIKVTPIQEETHECECCGKQAVLSKCTDCDKMICSLCGYTNIDVNTGKPTITCDECFTGSIEGDSTSTEWDISSFETNKEENNEVKEEKVDVKSRPQTRGKRSSKKSK